MAERGDRGPEPHASSLQIRSREKAYQNAAAVKERVVKMAVAGLAVSRWLLLGLLAAVLQAATINLNWTIAGVQNYTE